VPFLRLVPAVAPIDPAACADAHTLVAPKVPSPGRVFVPFGAAGTYGGDADLAPPALSVTKIAWWLVLAVVTYAAATGAGILLGWLIESLLVWGFP
jgi:hypothetical protein